MARTKQPPKPQPPLYLLTKPSGKVHSKKLATLDEARYSVHWRGTTATLAHGAGPEVVLSPDFVLRDESWLT